MKKKKIRDFSQVKDLRPILFPVQQHTHVPKGSGKGFERIVSVKLTDDTDKHLILMMNRLGATKSGIIARTMEKWIALERRLELATEAGGPAGGESVDFIMQELTAQVKYEGRLRVKEEQDLADARAADLRRYQERLASMQLSVQSGGDEGSGMDN